MLLSPLRFHALLEELIHAMQEKERRKEQAELWFADDILIYPENPGESIRKLLELIRNFSKVAKHKISIRNQCHFPYASDR